MPNPCLVGDHSGAENYATFPLAWAAESSVDYGSPITFINKGNVGKVAPSGTTPNGYIIDNDGVDYDGTNIADMPIFQGLEIKAENGIIRNFKLVDPVGYIIALLDIQANDILVENFRCVSSTSVYSGAYAFYLYSNHTNRVVRNFELDGRNIPSAQLIRTGYSRSYKLQNYILFGGGTNATGSSGTQDYIDGFSFNSSVKDYEPSCELTNAASEDATGSVGLTGYTSAELVDFAGGDYRTKATSDLATAGSGGSFIGAFLESSGVSVISGSGSLGSQQSSLVGTGLKLSTVTGSGTLQSINSIVSGSGSILSNITGLGNLQSGDSLLSGVGYKIVYVTGSGSLQSINSELSGIGFLNSATTGYGILELQDSILNGLGFVKSNHVGSGIIESGDSSISGIAISFKVINGNAAFATGDSSISGVGGATSGSIGYGSLLISESQLSGLGQVFGNVIGTGNLKSNSDLSGQGIVKGNIFAIGNIESSNSIIEGIGRISIKVIGTGSLASSDSILEGYDVLYTWNEICKKANTWTEINPTDVAMIRCGPAISLKSGEYPSFVPYEFISTGVYGSMDIIVNSISLIDIDVNAESISADCSNIDISIDILTIEQQSISSGSESISGSPNLILIIESNVIAQESINAGGEELSATVYGSIGIVIE